MKNYHYSPLVLTLFDKQKSVTSIPDKLHGSSPCTLDNFATPTRFLPYMRPLQLLHTNSTPPPPAPPPPLTLYPRQLHHTNPTSHPLSLTAAPTNPAPHPISSIRQLMQSLQLWVSRHPRVRIHRASLECTWLQRLCAIHIHKEHIAPSL